MHVFQFPFRPDEVYSSRWKLVNNFNKCSVPENTNQLQDWINRNLYQVKSILNGVALGTPYSAEIHGPAMMEGNQCFEQEVRVTAGCSLVEMHVTNWPETQTEDPMLSAMLDWLKAQKQKTLLEEHTSSKVKLVPWKQQNFMIHQGALYLCSMPKGKTEDLLLFTVPKVHHVTTLIGCHWDIGHQRHDHTLSLFREFFWWTGMTYQVQKSLRSCTHCL